LTEGSPPRKQQLFFISYYYPLQNTIRKNDLNFLVLNNYNQSNTALLYRSVAHLIRAIQIWMFACSGNKKLNTDDNIYIWILDYYSLH